MKNKKIIIGGLVAGIISILLLQINFGLVNVTIKLMKTQALQSYYLPKMQKATAEQKRLVDIVLNLNKDKDELQAKIEDLSMPSKSADQAIADGDITFQTIESIGGH